MPCILQTGVKLRLHLALGQILGFLRLQS